MIRLKLHHDDFRNTDRFIWINPAHIVKMLIRNQDVSRSSDKQPVYQAVTWVQMLVGDGMETRVLETPEEIVVMIREAAKP